MLAFGGLTSLQRMNMERTVWQERTGMDRKAAERKERIGTVE